MHKQEETAYRVYVTDSLRAIGENTAKYSGGGFIRERWIDLMNPKKLDNRTGEEIAADIIKKAGLVVKKSESA